MKRAKLAGRRSNVNARARCGKTAARWPRRLLTHLLVAARLATIGRLFAIIVAVLACVATYAAEIGSEIAGKIESGDYDAAISLLKPLAAKGNRCASYDLAVAYILRGGQRATIEAAMKSLLGLATTQGHCRTGAQYALGKFSDISGNYREAAKWYERAANANFPLALFDLGMLYYQGEGRPQNYRKAFDLLLRAAERGNPQAQLNVAIMLGQGKGVKQDLESAHMWAVIATNRGNARAKIAVAQGRNALPSETVESAETRARGFHALKDYETDATRTPWEPD